ncbi:hypothetical protein IM660_11820 [Ruania alkalisoli]|uniref:Type I restriction modification DNA specificity domain-containing protein n=1 Tax=Ruania alkalisoli TaxID=2779775 RepID=A0A7M1SPJ0_9MICO|nr:hypothetical protein [Ruania alkalisoli]QOR69385.1 hypothetical protein IM660_11820 [Ruania alkalisoli]
MTEATRRWVAAKLGDFMVERGGAVNPAQFPDEEFDLYSIPAHDRGGFDVVRGADVGSSKRVVAPGDVIVSKIVPHIRRARVVGPRGKRRQIASTEWITFRSEVLVPAFLRYFLVSDQFHQQFMSTVSGVGGSLMRAQPSRVKPIEVPVPSIRDQRRIVDILDDHFSRLDAGSESVRFAESRLSVFLDSIVDTAPELEESRSCDLAEILAQPLSNGKSVPTADGGFPVLRLTAMRDGTIDLRQRKTGRWSAEAAKPFLVSAGDVFVARGNGSLKLVGRAAWVVDNPDLVAYPDTMIRMRPDLGRIQPDYLTAVWNSRLVRRQIEARARTTAGIYKVNQGDLRRITLPVPSLEHQRAFIARLDEWSYAVHGTARKVETAARRANSLKRSLLVAAFSGKLTGAESDIEQVEEMAGV